MNNDSFSRSKNSVSSEISEFIISSIVSSLLKILIFLLGNSEISILDLQRAPTSRISLIETAEKLSLLFCN